MRRRHAHQVSRRDDLFSDDSEPDPAIGSLEAVRSVTSRVSPSALSVHERAGRWQTPGVMSALEAGTVDVVHRVWAQRLGVPIEAFDNDEPEFVDRSDLRAAVVVRLGGTSVVAAPEPALSALRRLTPVQLLEVDSLLGALEPAGPSLLGAASLSFADRRTLSPVTGGVARPAAPSDVAVVMARCSEQERDESGLAEMSARWVALGDDGPDAASGYEVWGEELAQVGVLVAPGGRGEGRGALVTSAALSHAMGQGLVPQWRCRVDNVASERLGERLGFVRIGEQIAIVLAAGQPQL